jgi:hypothetical protein
LGNFHSLYSTWEIFTLYLVLGIFSLFNLLGKFLLGNFHLGNLHLGNFRSAILTNRNIVAQIIFCELEKSFNFFKETIFRNKAGSVLLLLSLLLIEAHLVFCCFEALNVKISSFVTS